jgi:S-adenosylmethionine synthetase
MVFGEITTKAVVNYEQITRMVIKAVGYDDVKKGMDYKYSKVE